MKKLFQIGILLLFMIGISSVQLDYSTSILVDDDVGVKFATNIANDAILVTITIDNPSQVAAPLKYPIVASEMDIIYNRNSEVWKELNNNCTIPLTVMTIIQDHKLNSEISSTNLTNEKLTGKRLANINEGLFRLDIGENFIKT